MPPLIYSVNLILCETVIQGSDGVLTPVRIVDQFSYTPIPEVPVESQAVSISVLAMVKTNPTPSEQASKFQFKLLRPNGEESALTEPQMIEPDLPPKLEDDIQPLGGFNIMLNIGVKPAYQGVYVLKFMMDDEEISRAQFILIRRAPKLAQK